MIPLLFVFHFFYFVVAWGILHYNAKWRSLFPTPAAALQWWELLLFIAWAGQMASISICLLLNFDEMEFLFSSSVEVREAYSDVLQYPAMISFAFLLCIIGIGVKLYVPFVSGMNNYYYYDFMLQIPNERFVDCGLYKYCGSPTYMLGYLDGYGALLLYGALGMGSPHLGLDLDGVPANACSVKQQVH